jgi:hypothetical protein
MYQICCRKPQIIFYVLYGCDDFIISRNLTFLCQQIWESLLFFMSSFFPEVSVHRGLNGLSVSFSFWVHFNNSYWLLPFASVSNLWRSFHFTFCFFDGTGLLTQGLMLARQSVFHLNHAPRLFAFSFVCLFW